MGIRVKNKRQASQYVCCQYNSSVRSRKMFLRLYLTPPLVLFMMECRWSSQMPVRTDGSHGV